MKTNTFFLIAAAIATLGIAACEREEEPTGSPSVPGDTVPVVDTIPSDTVPAMPWYHSLVGTRWYCHDDFKIPQLNIHNVSDIYWDIVDDSTIRTTVYDIEFDGVPMHDTIISSIKYRYNPEELKCIISYLNNNTEEYYLDTVQKTLTYDRLPEFVHSQKVFYLIEE
jgi:hypothetical protein